MYEPYKTYREQKIILNTIPKKSIDNIKFDWIFAFAMVILFLVKKSITVLKPLLIFEKPFDAKTL